MAKSLPAAGGLLFTGTWKELQFGDYVSTKPHGQYVQVQIIPRFNEHRGLVVMEYYLPKSACQGLRDTGQLEFGNDQKLHIFRTQHMRPE